MYKLLIYEDNQIIGIKFAKKKIFLIDYLNENNYEPDMNSLKEKLDKKSGVITATILDKNFPNMFYEISDIEFLDD